MNGAMGVAGSPELVEDRHGDAYLWSKPLGDCRSRETLSNTKQVRNNNNKTKLKALENASRDDS